MAISDVTRTTFVWKKIKGRRHTATEKAWYEEFPGILTFPHATETWLDPIPVPAPGTTTSVVEYYDDLKLTEDASVANHRAWLACSTYGDPSTQLKGFVPPRYDQSYAVRVFQDDGSGNKGDEIPTTHESNWFFDYENGVLIFENDPTSYGLTPPFHIQVYRYIGKTVEQATSSTVSKLRAFLREGSNVTVPGGYSAVDISSIMSGKTPGGSETNPGVVTTTPYNRVPVLTYPDRDEILTPDGNKVYGRITENSGNWYLRFYYTAEDGTETSYTFESDTQIIFGYYEVLPFEQWPVFDGELTLPSDQLVGDIPEATTEQAGKVRLAEDQEVGTSEVPTVSDRRLIKTNEFSFSYTEILHQDGENPSLKWYQQQVTISKGIVAPDGSTTGPTTLNFTNGVNEYVTIYLDTADNTIKALHDNSAYPAVPDNGVGLWKFRRVTNPEDGYDGWLDPSTIEDIRPIYVAGSSTTGLGRLGVPSDGTYEDGLLDFTENTRVNDAVDDINEVLKYLAPSDAQPLNDIEWTTTLTSGYISAGFPLSYLSAGQLHQYITRDEYTYGKTADSAHRFNKADVGLLRLYYNDSIDVEVDLASYFNEDERAGVQSYPPVTITGTHGSITITDVRWYNDFPLWQKGNATFRFISNTAVDCKIKLEHYINDSTMHSTPEYIIFCDYETGRPGIANGPTVTEDTPVFKYLSGVKLYGANSTFKVSVTSDDKLFTYTYVLQPLVLRMPGMNDVEIDLTDPSVSGVSNPPVYNEQMTVTDKVVTLDASNVASDDAKLTAIPRDPWGNGTSATESITEARLVNTYGNVADDLNEYFQDENYRLPDTWNFDDTSSAITGNWDSTQLLNDGQAQVFNGRLIVPSVNYTTGYLPTQTADYSGFTSTTYTYYRTFQQAGTPHNSGKLLIGGISTSDIGSNVEIYIKLPGQTGWLSLQDPFNAATFTGADGDGAQVSITQSGSDVVIDWSSGTFSTADSGYRYYVKVVLKSSSIQVTKLAEIGW